METTKRVMAAIPEDKRDYRPDPNARSAWELAWHMANSDIQFLDGIADLTFIMGGRPEEEKPQTITALVALYDQNFKRASERARALSGVHFTTTIDLACVFNLSA